MSFSTATYPYDCVCYIVATFPDGSAEQGSGAIIGAHTVLTASHMLWNASTNEAASAVYVYPAYNGAGSQAISGQWVEHYYKVADSGGQLTESASQQDFAIVDFSANLSSYGVFGISTSYAGGQVHLTGYPATANGQLTDATGSVLASSYYSTLDYQSVSASPGNSGGPLWINEGTSGSPLPYLVGLVSTTAWAVQLTSSDVSTINGWEASDSYLWSGSTLAATQAATSIVGGPGPDTIAGWGGPDTLFGGAGDDSIVGGAGFNQVNGNAGNDTIIGHSTVGDWLLGGQGNDSIDASASTGNNIINGNLGNDTLVAGSGADSLRGGQGDDVIHAGSGNDWISGDLGNNTIYGGQGMDTFRSGGGHDYVNGWHNGDIVQVDQGVTVSSVSQVNADVHILLSNGGEVDLLNTQLTSLQPGWIITV
jgi:Ca2+-binding RTX toxin-like protein